MLFRAECDKKDGTFGGRSHFLEGASDLHNDCDADRVIVCAIQKLNREERADGLTG